MSTICRITTWDTRRKEGERIVFLHGTFDLFHRGHVEFLKESKKQGGLLIVGVDHDENVPIYKSKKKVVFEQKHRVRIISQVSCVDYVIPLPKIKSGESPDYHYTKLFLQVRPDVITHGADFSYKKEIEEKCNLIGIKRIEIVHKYSNLSTSKYINEIRS